MSNARCFLRMGSNVRENARTILDFVILQLQQKSLNSEEVSAMGLGAAYTTRPWALLFTNKSQAFDEVFQDMATLSASHDSGTLQHQKKWLDDIRICHVSSIHQLRALLCTIHTHSPVLDSGQPAKADGDDLLTWIHKEKDDQPPCFLIVMDLMDLILMTDINYRNQLSDDLNIPIEQRSQRYLQVRQDWLVQILGLLSETANYLSFQANQWWSAFPEVMVHRPTDLFITDSGCLETLQQPSSSSGVTPDQQALEDLYRIISYYIDQMM
ncbi:uncharacterized protein BYT42DRAFT_564114 [Radiomyces spectabilis]|uniref:uncharacterized protein n=1 Tax=Radiomyces spectabilis TaxID=64574 RepID=UPI0022210D3E|nr:uncharacterized protein BYT42DRAFT_564114 [Radiomyces spectabilis]KAI8384929.1 hypothetical protein BYT42DRAFT_564114 [Radiomyces spectabilis]